jgi:hypothetical protein
MTMKLMLRLLREPLFHFVTIGGLIYLVFVAVSDARKAPTDHIVVTSQRIDQLAAQFSSVWKRTPTADELKALIEGDIREEVYYRDALALGLDRNDTIVRRRLRQKMEFLTDTSAYLQEPSADELEAFLAAKEKAYRHGARLAFDQIYLGTSPTPERIARSMSALRSTPSIDPSTLGERTLLPAQLGLSLPNAVDGTFGKGFFERIAKFSPGAWNGPVQSGYSMHLIRIVSRAPARTPKLDAVRAAVLRDWKSAKAIELRERDYATRRKRFIVEIRRRDVQPLESQ